MLPGFMIKNVANCRFRNVEVQGNLTQRFSLLFHIKHLTNFRFRQFCISMPFSTFHSSAINRFAYVLRLSSRVKMSWVYAELHITRMQHEEPLWNRAVGQFIRSPMCRRIFLQMTKMSISVFCNSTHPRPARIRSSRHVHARPKVRDWIKGTLSNSITCPRTILSTAILNGRWNFEKLCFTDPANTFFSGTFGKASACPRTVFSPIPPKTRGSSEKLSPTATTNTFFLDAHGETKAFSRTVHSSRVHRSEQFITRGTNTGGFANTRLGHRESSFHGGLGSVGADNIGRTSPIISYAIDLSTTFHKIAIYV